MGEKCIFSGVDSGFLSHAAVFACARRLRPALRFWRQSFGCRQCTGGYYCAFADYAWPLLFQRAVYKWGELRGGAIEWAWTRAVTRGNTQQRGRPACGPRQMVQNTRVCELPEM